MTPCGMSLPAVPGLSGATWYPACWTAGPTRNCGCWSAARRWPASSASPAGGASGHDRWSVTSRGSDWPRRPSPSWATSTIWCTARRSAPAPPSSWPSGWAPRCTTCRRSRWPETSPASTPRPTSTSASACRPRITARRLTPSRWCVRRPGCGTASTARRWWWVIRVPARWTGSTGRTTSSGCWPSWRRCRRSPRCCCPTPGASTSSRSTTSPTPWWRSCTPRAGMGRRFT